MSLREARESEAFHADHGQVLGRRRGVFRVAFDDRREPRRERAGALGNDDDHPNMILWRNDGA